MKTFTQIGTAVGKLVQEKNAAYGSSFAKAGEFLRLLFPNGIPADRYDDALLLVRIFDKQMRIATDKDAFGETPYQDIAGYGVLGVHLHQQKKEDQSRWQGSASGPDAASSSKAQHDSVPQPVSATTKTSANAKAAHEPSPLPKPSSAASASASASTATERVVLNEVDHLRSECNGACRCANVFCQKDLYARLVFTGYGLLSNHFYCSTECASSDKALNSMPLVAFGH